MAKLELTYRLDVSEVKAKIEELKTQGEELTKICNSLLRTLTEVEEIPIKFEVMKTPEKETQSHIIGNQFCGESRIIETGIK